MDGFQSFARNLQMHSRLLRLTPASKRPYGPAMLRDAADPDAEVLAKPLKDFLLAYKKPEDSAAIEASGLQGVLQGDADGTIVNYTSLKEAGEKTRRCVKQLDQMLTKVTRLACIVKIKGNGETNTVLSLIPEGLE